MAIRALIDSFDALLVLLVDFFKRFLDLGAARTLGHTLGRAPRATSVRDTFARLASAFFSPDSIG